MSFIDEMIIKAKSRCVGTDCFGNQYYQESRIKGREAKRYVLYHGLHEPSKVPAAWHAWLHGLVDNAPKDSLAASHIPNLSGTKHACFPAGHPFNLGSRKAVLSDYKAWTPGKN